VPGREADVPGLVEVPVDVPGRDMVVAGLDCDVPGRDPGLKGVGRVVTSDADDSGAFGLGELCSGSGSATVPESMKMGASSSMSSSAAGLSPPVQALAVVTTRVWTGVIPGATDDQPGGGLPQLAQ